MKELYLVRQIRVLEALAMKEYNISEEILMERAGKFALDTLQKKWPSAKHVVVFCGNGNNAGDGYVLARLAAIRNLKVQVYFVGGKNPSKPVALKAFESCINQGVKVQPWASYQGGQVDVMVDALFGIGFQGELEGEFAEVASFMNATAFEEGVKILSLDIPSGLLADTGCVQKEAVKAHCTVTFIGMKQGLVTADGLDYSGEIVCDRLGLPDGAYLSVDSTAKILDLNLLKSMYLRPRRRNSHKGDFGHVLIVGGAPGMKGATRIAGEAALRMGAGLVTIATHPIHSAFLATERPEIMCYGVETPKQLNPLIEKATVIVIGMGLGQGDWGKNLLEMVIKTDKPLLLDADALNLLAEQSVGFYKKSNNCVLTPHPGEAARLLKVKTEVIQQDRFNAVKKLQNQWGGVCVLKGAGTLVKGEQDKVGVCVYGNPGMASGGMGDLLSGMIGGLLAQKIPLQAAAELGVCLHAAAADAAAIARGNERGLLAMDLVTHLGFSD